MINKLGKTIVLILVFLSMCTMFSSVNAAEPVKDVTTVTPSEPEPLSTVTFTSNITSDDTIEEVYLKIHECNPSICWSIQNESMQFDGEFYTVDFVLQQSKATYFNYSLEIKTSDAWYKTEEKKVDLKIEETPDDNNDDVSNGDTEDEDKGLPGFEVLTFIVAAVFTTLIIFRKKRV